MVYGGQRSSRVRRQHSLKKGRIGGKAKHEEGVHRSRGGAGVSWGGEEGEQKKGASMDEEIGSLNGVQGYCKGETGGRAGGCVESYNANSCNSAALQVAQRSKLTHANKLQHSCGLNVSSRV